MTELERLNEDVEEALKAYTECAFELSMDGKLLKQNMNLKILNYKLEEESKTLLIYCKELEDKLKEESA